MTSMGERNNKYMLREKERKLNKWEVFFIETALKAANLSTCYKTHVGAVIVKDNRIVSTGYNGTPPGWDHCERNHDLHKVYEIHAEINAISFAAKRGISTDGAEIYVTFQPCIECSKAIVSAGIKKVYYIHDYYDGSSKISSLDIFLNSGIEVIKVNPDKMIGRIIDKEEDKKEVPH